MNNFEFETELVVEFHGFNEEISVLISYASDGRAVEILEIKFPEYEDEPVPTWLYVMARNHDALREDMLENALNELGIDEGEDSYD